MKLDIKKRDFDLHLLYETDGDEDELIEKAKIDSLGIIPHFNSDWDVFKKMEYLLVRNLLRRNYWIQSRAAKEAGISARVFCQKIKDYGFAHPNWRINVPVFKLKEGGK